MSYILVEHYPELKETLSKAIDEAISIIRNYMPKYEAGNLYPTFYGDGEYDVAPNGHPSNKYWQEGFWPGQLWLAYEATGDEAFRELADKYVDDFYDRADKNYRLEFHHDLGFLYTPSCVSAYKLTGNETAKKAAQIAAYALSRRFRHVGQFIQSSGTDKEKERYRFIVDTMMNLPLLFWMTEVTGDDSYQKKAIAHMNTTLRNAMREDGTTFHHFLMDNETGEPVRGLTWQGAGDNSCWSRGQAWVVYGLALVYGYTKDESILEPFCKVTDYFLNHLPSDYVPYWDFIFTEGSDEPRDSSAGAIAACGILEMAKHLPLDRCNMQHYVDVAAKMIQSMAENYSNKVANKTEGLMLHGTGAKPQGLGIDVPLNFGDYYYLESLIRATRDWKSYW